MPRQHLPRVYWQNGYIDITRPELIFSSRTMTGKRILSFLIEEPCVEIDYEEQLHLAERLMVGRDVAPLHAIPTVERFPS